MREAILVCAVAAVLILGYFMIKKRKLFPEGNHSSAAEPFEMSVLRIAFEVPTLIPSVSEILEQFSKKNPDCELYLFFGPAEEILKKLEEKELDFGFVITGSASDLDGECRSVIAFFNQSPFMSEAVELPVIPLGTEKVMTHIIWKTDDHNDNKTQFAEQLSSLCRHASSSV